MFLLRIIIDAFSKPKVSKAPVGKIKPYDDWRVLIPERHRQEFENDLQKFEEWRKSKLEEIKRERK